MRWTWRRIPEGVLDPERQLGDDARELVDGSEFGELRKRLLRWQRTLGQPGDKMGGTLVTAVCAHQLGLGTPGSSET
jgi:hypothetical protein